MSQNSDDIPGLSVDISDELSKNLTIHKNVKQDIIITTEDKIRLVLMTTKEVLIARREWRTPFGLLLSFIATLTTSTFKDALGLKKELWNAIFILLAIISAGWLLYSFYSLYKNWNRANLDDIIKQIKLKDEAIFGSKKLLTIVPIDESWELNHWKKDYSSIIDGKMIFVGTRGDPDGCCKDLKDMLEIGKTYEISCWVKSEPNTSGRFQLWCHDHAGTSKKTIFQIPSTNGEIVRLNFTAEKNEQLRIHLEYQPGAGRIEVSDIKVYTLA